MVYEVWLFRPGKVVRKVLEEFSEDAVLNLARKELGEMHTGRIGYIVWKGNVVVKEKFYDPKLYLGR